MNNPLAPGYKTLVCPTNATPLPWNEYSTTAKAKWQALLDGQPSEAEVHTFLEHNPSFLPGVNEFGSGHHNPLGGFLYSKPRLPGLGPDRIPDFMWLGKTSAETTPVFIEIESPGKRWFRKDGVATAAFTEAQQQLLEWKAWLADAANQEVFRRQYYEPILTSSPPRKMRPIYVLIVGRRANLGDDPTGEVGAKRSLRQGIDEVHMTFDRLDPNANLDSVITVHPKPDGTLSAVAVPPTFAVQSVEMDSYARAIGLADVVRACDGMTQPRRTWVAEAVNYYAEVWRDGYRGTMGGDRS